MHGGNNIDCHQSRAYQGIDKTYISAVLVQSHGENI
jgi:hypothetical protein